MNNNNKCGDSQSGNYSQEDIITIDDSDSDEEFVARRGSDCDKPDVERDVERDVISIDDEEDDLNDFVWGKANDKPSTSGTNQVRRPQYNLSSSSSDDDSNFAPPQCTIEVIQKSTVNKAKKDSSAKVESKEKAPVNQTNKVSSTKVEKVEIKEKVTVGANKVKNASCDKVGTIEALMKSLPKIGLAVSPIIQQKKIAFVKPAVLQTPPRFIHKKPPIKKPKGTLYMPLSTNPSKPIGLRDQIRKHVSILPNTASNFSVKNTTRLSAGSAQKFIKDMKKKAIEATNRSVALTSNQTVMPKQNKPAVAWHVPNTSRMAFLLDPKKQEKDVTKEKVAPVCRDPRLARSLPANVPKNFPKPPVTSNSAASSTIVNNVPRPSVAVNSQVQKSTHDYMADLRQKKVNPPTCTDSNNEKHKKVKHRDSDYDINDVIKAKRLKREHEEAAARKRSESKEVIHVNDEQKDKCAVVSKKHNENNVKVSEPPAMNFSRTVSLTSKPVSADPVLLQVLNWRASWIKECQNQKEPPPVSSEPMKHLKTSYESINEYVNYFIPPLLHETWAQLIESVNSYKDTEVHVAIMSCDLVTMDKCEFAVMVCQTAIKKKQCYPREGDLVCVDLPFIEYESGQEQSRRMKAFGFITYVNIEPLSRKSAIAHNYTVPEGCTSLVKYEIRLKPRSHVLDYKVLMRMRTVLYVKPTIRNFEALLSLRQSVLCEDILKPRNITCHIITPTAVKMESSEYNESQYKAILGSVEAISRPFDVPKLLMIQGPPGTGKTHTLVGMIKKIFSQFSKNPVTPKILVCAPSNGAIDEIGKRLVRERANISELQDRHLKIVRIGQEKNVHPELQPYLLDSLVENNIKHNNAETKKNFESKKKELEDRISRLDQDIANYNHQGQHQEAKRCGVEMTRATKELLILKADDSKCENSENDLDKKRKRMKHDLLKKADVVLSTLNSCRMSVVEQIFNAPRADNSFTCVIIDEASQCTEPEILMPLIYTSISKMILIGDPMQLPATVISKDAARHRFGQSLFERLYSYFGNPEESPILMLNTQYRMHQDICSFPSKQFYGDKLTTCPSLSNRKFPLNPYVVFNVISTVHNKDDPKNIFNEGEAQFVMKLLTVIGDTLDSNASVGIITPYTGQKKLLEQKITKLRPNIVPQINTIDGFQGQEKDIIILSCVRAMEGDNSSIGFLNSQQRINVALTRAKFTLIICVAAKTLKNNELWDNLIKDATERKCLVNAACTARLEQIKEHLCVKSK